VLRRSLPSRSGLRYRLAGVLALGCLPAVLAPTAVGGNRSDTTVEFRGVTMRLPGIWNQRIFPRSSANALHALTVGNMQLGRPEYLLGHSDRRLRWPADGVLISLIDWSGIQSGRMAFAPATLPVRVTARNVGGFEGIPANHAFVRTQVRVGCKRLELWVQFGRTLTTRATIARANQALSSLSLAAGACRAA
jgi:hypothetical protein